MWDTPHFSLAPRAIPHSILNVIYLRRAHNKKRHTIKKRAARTVAVTLKRASRLWPKTNDNHCALKSWTYTMRSCKIGIPLALLVEIESGRQLQNCSSARTSCKDLVCGNICLLCLISITARIPVVETKQRLDIRLCHRMQWRQT